MTDRPPPVVLITGAAGNLGRAVAAVLRRQGLRLVLIDRDPNILRQAFGEELQDQLPVAA